MSWKYLNAAYRCDVVSGYTKYVLVRLADRCDEEKGQCWPSVPSLVADCGISRWTVRRSLDELKQLGAITWEKRGYNSNMYAVNLAFLDANARKTTGAEMGADRTIMGANGTEQGARTSRNHHRTIKNHQIPNHHNTGCNSTEPTAVAEHCCPSSDTPGDTVESIERVWGLYKEELADESTTASPEMDTEEDWILDCESRSSESEPFYIERNRKTGETRQCELPF
jgi:hypothetical protein